MSRPPARPAPPARGWMPGPGPWHRALLGAAGVSGLLGALLYDAFLLAWPLRSGLSPVNSFVSELAVPGQPASGFYRLSDLMSGPLFAVLAVGLAYHMRTDRRVVAAGAFLATLGLASVVDASHPLPCTPSTDAACRRQINSLSPAVQLHHPHAVSGLVEIAAVITAMLLLSRAVAVRRWSPRLSRGSAAAALVVSCLAILIGPLSLLGRWMGAVERVQIVITSIWIAAVSARLLRDAVRRSGTGPPAAGR